MSDLLQKIEMSGLDLASMLCSRVCHDVVGPVGAIVNGLELLDEDDSEEMRALSLDLIRKSARQASARLQFARIAFGAAGSAGSVVDLGNAQHLSEQFVADEKVKLSWNTPRLYVEKTRVKVVMNLLVIALGALPMGGTVTVAMDGDAENPIFKLVASGAKPLLAPNLLDLLAGTSDTGTVDVRSFHIFYTGELARACSMGITATLADGAVHLTASPLT